MPVSTVALPAHKQSNQRPISRIWSVILMRSSSSPPPQVMPGSPAEKCRTIQVGDIIVKVNGESIIGKSAPEIMGMIVGEEGTAVQVTLQSKSVYPNVTTAPFQVVFSVQGPWFRVPKNVAIKVCASKRHHGSVPCNVSPTPFDANTRIHKCNRRRILCDGCNVSAMRALSTSNS